MSEISLYIHIPFCKSKCHYCDFNSYEGKENLIPAYINALKREICIYGEGLKEYSIGTVYIGGGTPSLLDTQYLCDLMDTCMSNFSISRNAEITIESNPGTLTRDKLFLYKDSGINRISIGLQAWQDSLLEKIGRIHKVSDFIENFELAREAGFKDINVDLIFGLPQQTFNDWVETVGNVMVLGPSHISCYSLKIEEGTLFGRMAASGDLAETDDEIDRNMYKYVIEKASENKYMHYEISNFAKPGFKCRHNLRYWYAEEYIGIGAGAHSYFKGVRFNNVYSIEDYISSIFKQEVPVENRQIIDNEESMAEYMMLGLRLTGGVEAGMFQKRYGEDMFDIFAGQVEKLVKRRLISVEGERIRLTRLGLDLANQVFMEFI